MFVPNGLLILILTLCLFPSVLQLRLNYTNGVNTRIYNIINTYMLRIHIVSIVTLFCVPRPCTSSIAMLNDLKDSST